MERDEIKYNRSNYRAIIRTKFYWIGVGVTGVLLLLFLGAIFLSWTLVARVIFVIGVVFLLGWQLYPIFLSLGKLL